MTRPTFKDATNVLCLSGRELSELFGLPVQSVKQARMDSTNPGARPAPQGWERVLASIARRKGGELVKLAEELGG